MNDAEREASRWIAQARDDRRFAQWVLSESRFFDKGCFVAQQAGEKAVKACLYAAGRRRVLGHSVADLVGQLSEIHPTATTALEAARRLDRHYIPTRYPNGLPGGVPAESYSRGDLETTLQDLDLVFAVSDRFLSGRGLPNG